VKVEGSRLQIYLLYYIQSPKDFLNSTCQPANLLAWLACHTQNSTLNKGGADSVQALDCFSGVGSVLLFAKFPLAKGLFGALTKTIQINQ